VDTVASEREATLIKGKSSHRGHRGHRGGKLGLGQRPWGAPRPPCENEVKGGASHRGHGGCSTKINRFQPQPQSPSSVISVTSVRCFLLTLVSRTEATVSTKDLSTRNPNSPSVTSVTSVRCFSFNACFSHRSHGVHQRPFNPQSQFPLRDLCDLSAMFFL
jgi:hypothetical protein